MKILQSAAMAALAVFTLAGAAAVTSTPAKAERIVVRTGHGWGWHHRRHWRHDRDCRVVVRHEWRHGRRITIRRRTCW